ncbi:ABC transporter permease [Cytobacillus spongiae]|uniref:ABC transporter permease n=1 Tax=Cytobacillus spongiae TaxID=2901381 RepID=UPI001F21845C|nr:ABC transporter permease [Cytobacillus spongiae]UII55250.1 ABC transporter permease [Cytobacillus spongiae]
MSAGKLLTRRIKNDLKFQYEVFRSISDWTIVVYILIPIMVFVTIQYDSWWNEAPSWIEGVPLLTVLCAVYILMWNGMLRSYLQEADQIFLVKNQGLYLRMKRLAYLLAICKQTIFVVILYGIISPILLNYYRFVPIEWAIYLFYFIGLNWFIVTIKYELKKIQRKFIRIIVSIISFIIIGQILGAMYFLVQQREFWLSTIVTITTFAISLHRTMNLANYKGEIPLEISIEREAKLKYIQFIYQLSFDIEKVKPPSSEKPLLYRNSKRMFKRNRTPVKGMVELFLKVFMRNSSYWLTYLQTCSVSLVAIIVVPPLWMKGLIFALMVLMLVYWLELIFEKITVMHPLSVKYKEHESYYSAKRKMVWTLTTIGSSFVFFISILRIVLY